MTNNQSSNMKIPDSVKEEVMLRVSILTDFIKKRNPNMKFTDEIDLAAVITSIVIKFLLKKDKGQTLCSVNKLQKVLKRNDLIKTNYEIPAEFESEDEEWISWGFRCIKKVIGPVNTDLVIESYSRLNWMHEFFLDQEVERYEKLIKNRLENGEMPGFKYESLEAGTAAVENSEKTIKTTGELGRGIELTIDHLKDLKDKKELKGDQMNFYASLIQDESNRRRKMGEDLPDILVTNTFLGSRLVENLTSKNRRIFDSEIRRMSGHEELLIPYHIKEMNHWSLAKIVLSKERVEFYDSLNCDLYEHFVLLTAGLKKIFNWKNPEVERIKVAFQEDDVSCGLHVLKNMLSIVRGTKSTWNHKQVDTVFRKQIAIDCLSGRITV